MSDASITVRGADRLAATMHRAARDLQHMDTANQRVAMAIAQRSRSNAPRRTGALARSTVGRSAAGNRAEITATVIYAGVIHNGWRRHNIEPNPWLLNTVESTQSQWLSTYGQETQKIMDRVQGA